MKIIVEMTPEEYEQFARFVKSTNKGTPQEQTVSFDKTKPRLRTIPEALAELQRFDPSCALTLRALRLMAKRGEIAVTTVGSRRLININALITYIESPPVEETTEAGDRYGKIRRVKE